MTEPERTVVVHWTDAPPRDAFSRVSDTHFMDPYRLEHFILWRGRWCVVCEELLRVNGGDVFGEIDRQARDGTLGVLWEKR